ncbi:MAG: NADH-quinone oxidoreductase subunit L [Gammaproteobacteria bacterium]|nr:NADH-quinone oxidoreductase subunit L [Gammaproteobacteria bacterium]
MVAGLLGKKIGHQGASWVTISGMALSLICSAILFKLYIFDHVPITNETVFTWGFSGAYTFNVGLLIDQMTVLMMVTVNIVSLLVHIYSIGYMENDPGYQRFFAYMSLFTFFMLVLTAGNNFLVLFFGWEGVGLVSYLLIGFWFKKESAAQGSLKAFLVNRVGDFGFILGIAAIFDYFGSLDYATVFAMAPGLSSTMVSVMPGVQWSLMTLICILLFVGAMGKSAQIPLHIWLPESMEGPTPISALIHAATMVTAGIYMVARMSPLFELSPTALGVVLVFGATGALFLGLLALVENDIKRVIAYSTMSQLGYMMAANGASAYAAGMFHLVTHAFFKALLFLAAGSVIIALHHEQDMRNMGNLRKYLPITYITFLIGALSLSAIPPFSGFYSKDSIIEAVQMATHVPGAHYAYVCLLLAVFVTSLYIFRALFLTFHGKSHGHHDEEIKEPRWVVLIPLIVLAVPSLALGIVLIKPILFAHTPILSKSIYVAPDRDVLAQMAHEFHGPWESIGHALLGLPFWLAIAGIVCAWVFYIRIPDIPGKIQRRFNLIYKILVDKYGFDRFTDLVFVRGSQKLSKDLYQVADMKVIDHSIVNGTGRGVARLASILRQAQSGYLYHYAFAMILGLCALLFWMLLA